MDSDDRREPIYLTGGERYVIALALADYESTSAEMVKALDGQPGHAAEMRRVLGLRVRQCKRIARKMLARPGKAETAMDRRIRELVAPPSDGH